MCLNSERKQQFADVGLLYLFLCHRPTHWWCFGVLVTARYSTVLQDVLHWLIIFRIGALVWRCLLGLAPAYLGDICCPTPGTRGCSSLCSMERGYSLFLLPVRPQPRPVPIRWLVPLCGMDFLWHSDNSPGFFPTHSTLASKLFFLALLGSGAFLSSNVEEALYKSP